MNFECWNTADDAFPHGGTRAMHRGFVQKLADAVSEDESWWEAVAGLLALRAVDQWLQPVAPGYDVQPDSLSAVEAHIAQLGADSEVVMPLTRVVDCLRTAQRGASTDAIRPLCTSLHDYGRALEDAADWPLALDAYHVGCRVAVLLADPVRIRHDASLVLRMAIVHRNIGLPRDAAAMYARARELARSVSWREVELRADLGDVLLLITRGALPEAQQRLEPIASQAAADGLPAVQAFALHDMGMVLGMRGELGEAIKRLFDAYRLTPIESVADRWEVLADIAYAFSLAGLRDTARDVFRVIAARGPRRRVRWIAAINLMDLAAGAGDGAEFEHWRDWLSRQQMSPDVRANYCLDVGRGKLALGHVHEAVQTLELALGIAEEFGYGQFIFMAEAALRTARQRLLQPAPRPSIDEPHRDAEAIAEIGELLRAELAMA